MAKRRSGGSFSEPELRSALMTAVQDWCNGMIYYAPSGFRWSRLAADEGRAARRGGVVPYNRALVAAQKHYVFPDTHLGDVVGWMSSLCHHRDTQFGLRSSPPKPEVIKTAISRLFKQP